MDSIENSKLQTPIEIALGIDENGMITARKLYAFLELNPAHYARWFKSNITDNEFAEENVDFMPFTINGECGGASNTGRKAERPFRKETFLKRKRKRAERGI